MPRVKVPRNFPSVGITRESGPRRVLSVGESSGLPTDPQVFSETTVTFAPVSM